MGGSLGEMRLGQGFWTRRSNHPWQRFPENYAAPMPTCRILAIGDELILGRVIDTNSAWLSRWAQDRGLSVTGLMVVGDGLADIVSALALAIAQADVVLITGGLGPTDDDRTRHALAQVMQVPLRADPSVWRSIVRHFRRFGHGEPSPSNRRQALVPVGAECLANDRGTAPGLFARVGNCRIACFPGVPHEMEAMAQRLGRTLPRAVPGLIRPVVRELYLAGIGESRAQELIPGLLTAQDPQVGITASELGHLCLRVVGRADEVRRRTAVLRRRLRDYVLPAPGLAASLLLVLSKQGATVAAAESCTAGHVVAQLAAIPGASGILHESLVTYHERAKQQRLGVSRSLIRRHGVVSQAVVEAMVLGLVSATECDLGIATTGLAGPGGGTPAQPVGTVWLAVAWQGRVVSASVRLRGTRQRVQSRAAAQALNLAWQVLQRRQ